MRIVLLASIILQAIAIGMSFAENIGEEKQRIIRYIGWCQMELLFKAKWTTGLTTKAISCKSRLTVPHIWFMQQMLL